MSDSQQSLSPAQKRELLERLLQERAAQQPRNDGQLTAGQQALWFIQRLVPENTAYNIAFTARILSELDLPAFQHAIHALLQRHAPLRTRYEEGPEGIVAIADQDTANFKQIDAQTWDEETLYQAVLDSHKQPFDLRRGPVIRWRLFSQASDRHVLLISVHHIAADGQSMVVMLHDLKALYDAECSEEAPALPPIKPYSAFVQEEHALLHSAKGESLKNYWLDKLSGELPILDLPTDYPRPVRQTYNGVLHEFIFDYAQMSALKTFATQEGATLFMLLLAGFQALLHRYSRQDDLLVGTPVSLRDVTQYGGTIGYFVGPVVLRSHVTSDLPFRDFLAQTQKTVLEGITHRQYPFTKLAEQLNPVKDLSRSPIFQVMFNMQNMQRVEATSPLYVQNQTTAQNLTLESYIIPHEEGQFDLTLDVIEANEGLLFQLKYNTDLYQEASIQRMAHHYTQLLQTILTQPDTPIPALSFITEKELHRIAAWNATQTDYPAQTVTQLFEQRAAQSPQAAALYYAGKSISYSELNHRANQFAHALVDRGIGHETLVGLCVDRSPEMIIALLGILKAGGTYLPLDPSYPQERLNYMIADSQLSRVVLHSAYAEKFAHLDLNTLHIDTDWPEIAHYSSENPAQSTTLDHAAYVIYTSGSTGQPKGVVCLQRGLLNRCHWMWQTFPFAPDEVACQKTVLNFVDSIWEIFGPLLAGIPNVIIPDDAIKSPRQLIDLLNTSGVTRLVLVPSLLRALLENVPDIATQLPKLRHWITSGEALTPDLAQQFSRQLPQAELINLYGSSEVAADVTYYRVDPHETYTTIPIGKPIHNTQIHILDEGLHPVPIGMPGEIYVGGDGLARGYLHKPDLTAERFITPPQNPSERLYRTGDIGRYREDGEIEYLGRTDHQVKLRGFRIELGEIENTLRDHPAIQNALVMVQEHQGDPRLTAYYVPQEGQNAPDSATLREYLQAHLPQYMIPNAFVHLEAFPLLPNGKINRHKLPLPQEARIRQHPAGGEPQSPMEKAIAQIWADILHIPQISVYDNFFDLGGHSLQAVQVTSRIEAQTGHQVDPVHLQMQTLGQLAARYSPEAKAPTEEAPASGLFSKVKRLISGNAGNKE